MTTDTKTIGGEAGGGPPANTNALLRS